MNRQLAQILIGATALTGAFFFGSVMQRRHGDLEKTSSPQPMLENEDLVWHSETAKKPAEAIADKSPALSVAESTAGQPATPATEVPGQFGVGESSPPSALERKVVQPDFSHWSNPAGNSEGEEDRPSPMLPLTAPPQLLAGPTRPEGQVNPQPQTPSDPLESIVANKEAPVADPWTAPLSSVLLKPPSPSLGLPQRAAVEPAPRTDAPPATALSAPAAQTRLAATELVPVNQSTSLKAEVDTDSFRIHVTRPGDTLQALAVKYYGKADYYLDIYLANQDQLDSPIHLPAGKPLKIPDYGK